MANFFKASILLLTLILSYFASSFFGVNNYSEENIRQKTFIKFKTQHYDFGNIEQSNKVGTYFKYKNEGENELKIESIEPRCGCTVPNWSRDNLGLNQYDSIYVEYDAEQEGYFSKQVYVFSNSESSPDVLYIKGNVLPDKITKRKN